MKRLAGHIPVSDELSLLAEPHRLRILHLLEGLELTVGELARSLQSAQSTVSRHLKQLAEAGWLVRRTAGTATFYSMVLDELTIERRKLWITVREHSPDDSVITQDRLRADAVIADRSLDSAAFFGRVAGEWDEVRSRLFGTRFTSLSLAGLLRPDWVVADLGCGTGNVAELIAPWVERVVAVDASEAMLDAARQRLAGQDNIDFTDADLCETSIAPGTVDAALMTLVLHHVDDPAKAVTEAVRTLRATRGGGALQVVEIGPHDREDFKREMGHMRLGFAPSELREMFEQAGLSRVRVTALPPEPGAEGPALLAATGWLRPEATDQRSTH